MKAADKPVKIHEFTAESWSWLQPGEHVLFAVILGPDFDDPSRHTLHLRGNAPALEVLRALPEPTKGMILEHYERLLSEFRKLVAA